MMSKNAKRKILTAAVLCVSTTLWASPTWAADYTYLNNVLYGGGGPQVNNNLNSSNNNITVNETTYEGTETGNISGNVKGVYGGFAFSIDRNSWYNEPDLTTSLEANNNKVVINGGTIVGGKTTITPIGSYWRLEYDNAVVGGYSNYTSNNIVTINNGNIKTNVYGGYSMVSGNEDEVGGVNSENYVDKINNNRVEIKGSSSVIEGINIAGAYVDSDGEYHNRNLIRDNSVVIDNVTIKKNGSNTGNIYGAYSSDINNKLSNNSVIINSGIIETNDKSSAYGQGIFGACADGKAIIYDENDREDKDKDYNGDGIKNDYIGSSVEYNSVTINGGKITGAIYGAYAYAASDKDSLSYNKVYINEGTIIGDVFAVYSRISNGTIKNNGIEIKGTADLSQANLHGFRTEQRSDNQSGQYLKADNYQGTIKSIDKFDIVNILNNSNVTVDTIDLATDYYSYIGNLNLQNSSLTANTVTGITKIDIENSELIADKLDHFDYLEIDNDNQKNINLGIVEGWKGGNYSTITTDSKFTADSIKDLKALNVDMSYINWEKDTAVIEVSGTADFTGTAISATGILAAAAGTEVQNGDTMSFIKAGTLSGAEAKNINIDNLQISFATEAQVEVQDGNNSIDFVITGGKQATEQVSIIGESRTAAIAFVNQGSDILNNAFGLMDDGKYGIKTFAAAHGNYSKYETGSHIRVNGWSMLAGVGSSEKVNDGTFSWGVFFENGSGNYRTYNDYNGFNLEGFGSAVYNGGGALARYRSNAGNYAEVGMRAGMLKNSLSNAVADGFGVQGGYDEDTTYYGAHVGAGHIFTLDDHSSLDVYGKYFYNHHESEDLNILGDEVRFDSADSNRLRLGLRYNQNDGNAFSHYYGLAWDYEFNGDANVTAAGFDTGNPSLKGSTAVIEAGIHYAPDNSPWSIDLGLQGYGGQRDGFSGTMQLNYSFN